MKQESLDKIKILNTYIKEAEHIVFFGGAGVSTESGIPDFRSASGIYTQNLRAEEIVSHDYFFYDTKGFYKFYKEKMVFLDAKPNPCHLKLAEIEKSGKDITVVTQNIDNLHQLAGSKNVIQIHGTIEKNHCLKCGESYSVNDVMELGLVPVCPKCGGIIKPDVVLYQESLHEEDITKALEAISRADLLIVGGTSLKVYPAASFLYYYHGKRKVIINLNDNPLSDYLYINEKIGEVFSMIKI